MRNITKNTLVAIFLAFLIAKCFGFTQEPRISIDYATIESTEIGRTIKPYIFISEEHIKNSIAELIDRKLSNRNIDSKGIESLGAACDKSGTRCIYSSELTYHFENLPPANKDKSDQKMNITITIYIKNNPPNIFVEKSVVNLSSTK